MLCFSVIYGVVFEKTSCGLYSGEKYSRTFMLLLEASSNDAAMVVTCFSLMSR